MWAGRTLPEVEAATVEVPAKAEAGSVGFLGAVVVAVDAAAEVLAVGASLALVAAVAVAAAETAEIPVTRGVEGTVEQNYGQLSSCSH